MKAPFLMFGATAEAMRLYQSVVAATRRSRSPRYAMERQAPDSD
jgi:hypothetical protein